jgi:hypothetical protein
MRGEVINKANYCFETECITRAFDRDIEDIRLYLSEVHDTSELNYDRQVNGYYLTEAMQQPLEEMEYLLIEKVMAESGVLRQDEMQGILLHLAMHSENPRYAMYNEEKTINSYHDPEHGRPLLKLFGDLTQMIDNHKVICLHGDNSLIVDQNILPYNLSYYDRHFILSAFTEKKMDKLSMAIEQIDSFSIIRNQTAQEKQYVANKISSLQGGV